MTLFGKKVNQIRHLLTEKKIDGLLLTQQKNVSWLTSGRSFVNQASETAIAYILITKESSVLIVNNVEKDRLLEEEMKGSFDCVEVFPWHEPLKRQQIIEQYTSEDNIEIDTVYEEALLALRTTFFAEDIDPLRQLGKEAALAIEKTVFELQQRETEYEIAGRLAGNCLCQGIEPIVTLVAVDQRVFTRRHPLPTHLKLQKYAMLVLCGRRNGQVISVSRLVHFGEPSPELSQLQYKVAEIDAKMIAHTVPGTTYSELFERMKEAYRTAGYGNTWHDHHQGGLSGYNTREMLLLPGSQQTVSMNQVFAWNPSIAGVKSEDTILIGEKDQEILTHTGEFPYHHFEINGHPILRPSIFVRS